MYDQQKTLKIMVLAPDLPFPIRAGGQKRMSSIIMALSRFATIHLVCIADNLTSETREWIKRLNGSIAIFPRAPQGFIATWTHRIKSVLSGCNLYFDIDEKRLFEGEFQEFKPNVVWLESPYLLRYALDWRKSVPVVVDFWGTSQGQRRDFEHAKGLSKVWEYLRWKTFAGTERRFCPLFRSLVTVSEFDARFLREVSPLSQVTAIPNGLIKRIDVELCTSDIVPNRLIFTGDMSYRPNVDAAVYFVKQILPLVRSQIPSAHVVLSGRTPSPAVENLAEKAGVVVTGFVPDLVAEIAKASVYILPMQLGSGIRSKLFDVFSMCRPIVTTSIGAEGLELRNNVNCLIADSARDFAMACVTLLSNEPERRRLSQNLERMAEEVYTQDKVEASLGDVLENIAI